MADGARRWATELSRREAAAHRPTSFDVARYLGSPLPARNVPVPARRAIVRAFVRAHPSLPIATVHRVAAALWAGPTYNDRALAIELLRQRVRDLDATTWALVAPWVDAATGWGLSDDLAGGPIAALVAADPRRVAHLMAWTRSPNPWRRRAALYALNRLVRTGRLAPAYRVLDRLRSDPEFWVQRAVGTWLRECGKVDPNRQRAYLERHLAVLPPVALSVATERAGPRERADLRTRARKARGASGRRSLRRVGVR